MASPSFPIYGTPDVTGGFSSSGLLPQANEPIGLTDTSTFDPGNLLVDPTNTGDTGVLQDTSTPFLPSINNPETAGTSDLGAILNKVIDSGFAAWQLASQPKGTPKTVITQSGPTKVISGSPSAIQAAFGRPGTVSENSFIILIILLLIGIAIFRK